MEDFPVAFGPYRSVIGLILIRRSLIDLKFLIDISSIMINSPLN